MVNRPKPTQTSSSSHRPDQIGRAHRLRLREQVDDAAEQHRLGELRHGQRHIGERQRPARRGCPIRACSSTRP